MLDILHNGVTKKVNATQEENAGLLIVSGIPKWDFDSDNETYTAILINSGITTEHLVQSFKVIKNGLNVSDWVTTTTVQSGYVTLASTNSNIVGAKVICELYNVTDYSDRFGFLKNFENVSVNFSNWNVKLEDDIRDLREGTVKVSIQDASIRLLMGCLLPDTFEIESDSLDDASISVFEVVDIEDNNDLICHFYIPGDNDFVSAVTDASISFVYYGRHDILSYLPEADAEWVESSGTYRASFTPEIPTGFSLSEPIAVYGENGEEFQYFYAFFPGQEPPERYLTVSQDGTFVAAWRRDTAPEITKLTAKVYLANYTE